MDDLEAAACGAADLLQVGKRGLHLIRGGVKGATVAADSDRDRSAIRDDLDRSLELHLATAEPDLDHVADIIRSVDRRHFRAADSAEKAAAAATTYS